MTELDAFERRLEAAFQEFADRGVTPVRAVAFAEHVAGRPRRHWGWLAWPQAHDRLAAVPTIAWILLATGLLLGMVAGGLVVGSWRPDQPVVSESPSILATTKAHPLPAQATCPPGSNPDAPGSTDQERPGTLREVVALADGSALLRERATEVGVIAFDRRAGRIVTLEGWPHGGVRTWTFDVCTNTWQLRSPLGGAPGSLPVWLVYDADSDRTVALTAGGQFWSYDEAANRWTESGQFPEVRRSWLYGEWSPAAVYHDASGLIVVYDGATMWAYDVEASALTEIRQRPDPSRPVGSGFPPDPWAFDRAGAGQIGYDPRSDLLVLAVHPARPQPQLEETWTFKPSSGSWELEGSASTQWRGGHIGPGVGGPAPYDEVTGRTLFGGDAGLWAFDGGTRAWRTAPIAVTQDEERQLAWCASGPVYDPLNRRSACLGGAFFDGRGQEDRSGVSAFSTATGQWRWLLEPTPTGSPAP